MAKRTKFAWNATASASTNARVHLPTLAEDYFRAGRRLLERNHPAAVMHKFRLRTKHFRYTLELFRDVYGKSMENRLELLKPLQDALGDLNDCATARELPGGKLPKIRAFLKERSKKKTREFRDYWQQTFDKPGASEAWRKWLSGARSE